MYVSVYIDELDVLEKAETSELAKEIVSRPGWQSEVREACKEEHAGDFPEDLDGDPLFELIDRARLGLPVQEEFVQIAQSRYGIFLGPMAINLPR